MSHAEKSAYYRELKAAGVAFEKTYQQYSTDELKAAVQLLRERTGYVPPEPEPEPLTPIPDFTQMAQPALETPVSAQPHQSMAELPTQVQQMAGVDLNRKAEDEPLFTDPETGFVWYQREVRKPSMAQPRGRRVLRYLDTGTKQQTVQEGQFLETFEVAGNAQREAEVKVTLPSYQVGIYKDPRFPFKVHVYNEKRGFDLFEVQAFYGGADLVPPEVKRVYVENSLCYDIRTTVRAIQTEARQLELAEMRGTR